MRGGWTSGATTLIQEVNFPMILRTLLKISFLGAWCNVTPVFLLVSWHSWLGMYSYQNLCLKMWNGLPFTEDINLHENMGVKILKLIVQKCGGTGMTPIRLKGVFIYLKPACIAQQKYTASKKYDTRCSFWSDRQPSLAGPWREGKVEGSRGLGKTSGLSFLAYDIAKRSQWGVPLPAES